MAYASKKMGTHSVDGITEFAARGFSQIAESCPGQVNVHYQGTTVDGKCHESIMDMGVPPGDTIEVYIEKKKGLNPKGTFRSMTNALRRTSVQM